MRRSLTVAWASLGLQAHPARGSVPIQRVVELPLLNEKGYRSLTGACVAAASRTRNQTWVRDALALCDAQMEAYIARVAALLDCEVVDRAALARSVPWYSGRQGARGLPQLEEELLGASWTLCGLDRAPGLRGLAALRNALVRRLRFLRVLKAHGPTVARLVLCAATGAALASAMWGRHSGHGSARLFSARASGLLQRCRLLLSCWRPTGTPTAPAPADGSAPDASGLESPSNYTELVTPRS